MIDLAPALARKFADLIERDVTPEELADIKARNSSPEYAHDCICATHDIMDANMTMWEAFEAIVGHPPAFVDECDNETSLAEMALWNAAWTLAKKDYLS